MRGKTAFLMAAVFVATLFLLTSPPVSVAKEIKLTYANFPPAPTFPCVQMERWAKEVENRTKGAVKVQTFPGGTLLPAKNIFDGVIAGTADIGNFAMSYQPGRFIISEAVDLPLGFSSAKSASLTLLDLIEKYNAKEFADVKILTMFTCPPANIMTRDPVKTLADLKGKELRVAGHSGRHHQTAGGNPGGHAPVRHPGGPSEGDGERACLLHGGAEGLQLCRLYGQRHHRQPVGGQLRRGDEQEEVGRPPPGCARSCSTT